MTHKWEIYDFDRTKKKFFRSYLWLNLYEVDRAEILHEIKTQDIGTVTLKKEKGIQLYKSG